MLVDSLQSASQFYNVIQLDNVYRHLQSITQFMSLDALNFFFASYKKKNKWMFEPKKEEP